MIRASNTNGQMFDHDMGVNDSEHHIGVGDDDDFNDLMPPPDAPDEDAPEEDLTQTQPQYSQNDSEPSQSQSQEDSPIWAYIRSISGPSIGHIDPIILRQNQTTFTIGRKDTSDLVLKHPKVSNIHCILEYIEPGKVRITDKSRNGTFIDRKLLGRENIDIRDLRDAQFLLSLGKVMHSKSNEIGSDDLSFHISESPVTSQNPAQRYSLHKELGSGAFATVYQAVETATGEYCAVKKIDKHKYTNDQEAKRLIDREHQIMKQVDHKNIVRYKDYYEDDNFLFIVMEFVDGGQLLDYALDRHISEEQAKDVAYMLCSALVYIHKNGIIHRDLKPENILLTSGSRPEVKISDFGLSAMIGNKGNFATMCGTPIYIAPEVILNPKGYSYEADYWSVGVVMFAILTKNFPFESRSDLEIRDRMSQRTPNFDSLDEQPLSPNCINFVKTLLSKDPKQRLNDGNVLKHPFIANRLENQPSSLPTNTKSILDGLLQGLEELGQDFVPPSDEEEAINSPARLPPRSGAMSSGNNNFGMDIDGLKIESVPPSMADCDTPGVDENMKDDSPTSRERNMLQSSVNKRKQPVSSFSSDSILSSPSPSVDEYENKYHKDYSDKPLFNNINNEEMATTSASATPTPRDDLVTPTPKKMPGNKKRAVNSDTSPNTAAATKTYSLRPRSARQSNTTPPKRNSRASSSTPSKPASAASSLSRSTRRS